MKKLPSARCLLSGWCKDKRQKTKKDRDKSISQEVVEATMREETSRGKNEARRLRVSGRVPGVVYGAKKASLAVSVDPKQINKILASDSGHNTIFDLNVGGENAKVMIVD